MISVLASPMLARCEASLADSMNFCAAAAALDAETEDRPHAFAQVLLPQFVAGMRRQARIVDPRHQRVRLQMPGQRQGVLTVPRHPQMQRLQPLQEEEAVERADRPAQVAEPVRAAGEDVAQLPHRVVKNRPVI